MKKENFSVCWVGNFETRLFPVTSGVPQGSVSDPLMLVVRHCLRSASIHFLLHLLASLKPTWLFGFWNVVTLTGRCISCRTQSGASSPRPAAQCFTEASSLSFFSFPHYPLHCGETQTADNLTISLCTHCTSACRYSVAPWSYLCCVH